MSSRNENSCLQTLTIGKPVLLCPGFLSGKQADVVMAAPRSPDTSLDSSKAFALGYQPLPLRQELTALPI